MSDKISKACVGALAAAVTLSHIGPARFVLPAAAEDSFATILAPADGAKLEAKHTYKVEYEVKAAPKVDHVHLFVDGDEVGMAHRLKGSFKLVALKPGDHKVCVSPVNKNHTPIGAQACITVTVQ
ncbi:MAG TPA: hypothetical protein VL996_12070 [Methylocella sp.]|nr:hypothetical protein [Methylocella sp.]